MGTSTLEQKRPKTGNPNPGALCVQKKRLKKGNPNPITKEAENRESQPQNKRD